MFGHGYMERAAVRALPTTRGHNVAATTWLCGLFLMMLCFAFPGAAHSATYYVSVSGNDSSAGTSSAPWRTIQHAVYTVSPGDTVMINDGTYSESVKLDEMQKGSSTVTLQAINARKVILSPGGSNGFYDDYAPLQNIKFVGLKINSGRVGMQFSVGGNGIEINNCEITGFIEGIRIPQGQNIHILDCYVHDNQNGVLLGVKDVSGIQNILVERTTSGNNNNGGNSDGFMVEGMCTNLVFRDCVAYGSGDTGFDCKPDATILERCKTYNNNGWGVKFWGNGSKAINCITYGNKIDGFGCSGDTLSFIGCTLGPNTGDGIRLETSNVGTCTVRDCIFYNTDLYCFASSLPKEDYNCYYNTSGGYVIRLGSTTYTPSQVQSHSSGIGSHDIGKDPAFVGAGSANYALTNSSPCIGAGIADSLLTVDFNNKTRLNPPDMGAIANGTGGGGGTPAVPTAPTGVSITNGSKSDTTTDLTAVATGSTCSTPGTITYQYQWARSTDGGTTWSAWGWTGATLPSSSLVDGQVWKAHACATIDGTNYSAWKESATCTISSGTATLAAPTAVSVTPTSPADTDNLTATATGGGKAGSTPSYEYQWAKSTNGGSTWGAWGNSGSILLGSSTTPGDMWKAQARAIDGTNYSAWTASAPVTIAGAGGTVVPPPTSVTITPSNPTDADNLMAGARGGGLVSTDTYQTQWARSTNGGSTWGAWTAGTGTLPASSTFPGDSWKAHMRVVHGTDYSVWTESQVVSIPGGSTSKAPTSVVVTPASPADGNDLVVTDSPAAPAGVTYTYQWHRSTNGGTTWGAWGHNGSRLAATYTKVGDQWQARSRAVTSTTHSDWVLSNIVTIGGSGTGTTGVKVTISPSSPADGQNLVINASGTYSNGKALEFEYYFSRSTDGGATWEGWNYGGQTLSASETHVGEMWRAEAQGYDGSAWGPWVTSAPVTIH